jgi:hypothetical protein
LKPSVDPDRFLPADHELFPSHWAIMPVRWHTLEEGLLAGETREVIAAAVAEPPVTRRTVIALRNVARRRRATQRPGQVRRAPATHPTVTGSRSGIAPL